MQRSLFGVEQKTAAGRPAARFRQELNPAQYEAVTTVDGPVLVIAGAGSGKTRTLVYRMAYLLEQGLAPENLLLLTFTRKAAQEMLLRAGRLVDESCQRVTGGTFHAVANLLLRRYGHHLGYSPNFTILDRADSEGIVNLLKSSLNLGGAGRRFPSKRLLVNLFSKAVNKSEPFAELVEEQYGYLAEFLPEMEQIREHFRKFKLQHGLMDYDDLLLNWKRVLEIPEIRAQISHRFTHLMVDEYQDTNRVQAEIVRLIGQPGANVMVVGDDCQSVYSFRGAEIRNIMDFPDLFPGTRIIRLEENYRSTQAILTVTNAIIAQAGEKYAKTLFSRIEGGPKPVVYGARDEAEQARYVAEQIAGLQREGCPLGEMAVLFRSGFHSYKLELELANRQLLFEKRGGQKLTESAHIKDVLSYLRVTTNPHDHLSWNRLLLLVEKIGPKTARTILDRIRAAEDPLEALAAYPAARSWAQGLREMTGMLLSLRQADLSPSAVLERVMAYYQPVLERLYTDDYPRRGRDLEQLGILLAGYDTLQAFIDDTALDPPDSRIADPAETQPEDRLVLSTVHSAKGLEWKAVFIIHLTEGKFPSAQVTTPEEREEERRLFYVAATRAKEKLFFVYPREVLSPERQLTRGTVSLFLDEIPGGLLENGRTAGWAPAPPIPRTAGGKPGRQAGLETTGLPPGTAVRHPFFGEGRVEAVSGPRTVEVLFARHGRKTLHLDYAKLELVGQGQ